MRRKADVAVVERCASRAGERGGEVRAGSSPERALAVVADDDTDLRSLVATTLEHAGFEVIEAADGDRLLAVLRAAAAANRRPALIVSDVHMPGQSGLTVLRRLRAWLPDVPVVMVTGSGDASTHAKARRLGAVAVLNKPFDLGALRRMAAALIAR